MNQGAKILLVDDDATMHDVLREEFGSSYQVLSAYSGSEALAAVPRERPDLILLDVEMPDVNGYETCRAIKRINAGIPVLFVSGRDRIEDRLKGYDAGGEDYLAKPFNLAEVRAKIENLLRHGTQQNELRKAADLASRAAVDAITSMGEMGTLLSALRTLYVSRDFAALADSILESTALYGLHAVTQVRSAQGTITRSASGESSPLTASLIGDLASAGRTVQVNSRLSITHPHVSLLVSNLPVADVERCKRVSEQLATLIEAAEAHSQIIEREQRMQARWGAAREAIGRIAQHLIEIEREIRQAHDQTALALDQWARELARADAGADARVAKALCEQMLGRVQAAHDAELQQLEEFSALVDEIKDSRDEGV